MASVVRLDDNRLASVDGRPFFLIGARHMPDGGTPAILAEAGFNAYRRIAFGHETGEPEPLPEPDEDILFWSYIFDRAVLGRSVDYRRQLEELARQVRHHPGMLCYENYNEVAWAFNGSDPKAAPDELAEGTALLRELDPDHPVWLAHSCDRMVRTLAKYNSCMDILGCNPYPVVPPGIRQHVGFRPDGKFLDCPDQTIHAVGKYTDKMMRVGGRRMPVWMLIQGMAHESWFNPTHTPEMAGQGMGESKILYPTYDEMRFMAHDAIVHGATGLAFALHKTPVEGPVWQDIKRLVGELRRLHEALAAPPVPEPVEVSYTELGFTVWDGVRTLVRRKGNDVYLFAVNTAFDPAQVAMRLPGVSTKSTAVVESEDREVALEDETLSDYFEPYAVHVYRIGVFP